MFMCSYTFFFTIFSHFDAWESCSSRDTSDLLLSSEKHHSVAFSGKMHVSVLLLMLDVVFCISAVLWIWIWIWLRGEIDDDDNDDMMLNACAVMIQRGWMEREDIVLQTMDGLNLKWSCALQWLVYCRLQIRCSKATVFRNMIDLSGRRMKPGLELSLQVLSPPFFSTMDLLYTHTP